MITYDALMNEAKDRGMPSGKTRGILREYLQVLTLKELYKTPAGKQLYFTGGTYLRLVQGTKRFSEDLDFNAVKLTRVKFEETVKLTAKALLKEGFTAKAEFSHRDKLLIGELIFPDAESKYGIISKYSKKEGIVLKVEANLPGGKALVLRHVFGFIVNFLGGVILARYFGPEIIGTYYISFTIFMFGRALVDFGVLTHFIRLHEEPDTAAIKAAFGLQQIIGLCYVFICAVIVVPLAAKYYAVQGISWLIMSAAVASYFYSWQSVPLSLFERKVDYKKVGIVEVSEIISFNIAAVTIGLLKDIISLT